jgi:trehalose 6-phosphate synthase
VHQFRIRLILALIVSVTAASAAFTYFDVLAHRHVLRQELDRRTQWMGISILPDIEGALRTGDTAKIAAMTDLQRSGTGALALAIYDTQGKLITSSGSSDPLKLLNGAVGQALEKRVEVSQFGKVSNIAWLATTFPLYVDNQITGAMALVVDAGSIRSEANAVWRRSFWLVAICVALVVGITIGMISWFVTRPMSHIADRLRRLRTGHGKPFETESVDLSFFSPIAREFENIAHSLKAARAAATTEAHLRESGESWWTAEKLTVHMRKWTGAGRIFVVSNREPYMHVRNDNQIDCVIPPSGLVTALEPVLRACDGVWIAHGGGNADALTVDDFDHLRVPPEDPKYTLRRVWLSEEEESQYYDGFANEGLWPLCHIAHTRPIFRAGDWECYQRVNERFARALLAEMKDCVEPIVFVQDYHFALIPRMIKRVRPEARVAIFWHIPWPNPEAFGICPWQNELLDGLLGADLIGFHIPLHCHNFVSTVDRVLESRTSQEHMTIRRHGHETTVRPYPISVAVEGSLRITERVESDENRAQERHSLLHPFGVHAEFLAIGVDRLDYTKGIEERMAALEHLLEHRPWYRGRLTLVQIAAPSRTRIPSYVSLRIRVEEMADRINARFQNAHWKPVILIERQCSHEEIERWYNNADICLVTSLHDGMNLVAKEFVAARTDEDGVLILSRFTGAAGELHDALLVNPYDIAGVADAMHFGIQMNHTERRERMNRMRRYILEHNVYLWGSSIIGDLRELRIETDENSPISQASTAPEATIVKEFRPLEKKSA